MISIKNSAEITKMREANRIVALLLRELESIIKVGVSTFEINKFSEKLIKSEGGKPAFKGYSVSGLSPFPAAICASVNSCIVHGIPSKKEILQDGDIIGVDVGVYKNGFYGDAARTYRVGQISASAEKLLQITQEALERGMAHAKNGARVGDVSNAIGSFIEANGYFVADSLTGHGIGRQLHEEPMIPNFGLKGKGPRLRKGMTIAIEPMVNIGTNKVMENGWEYFTADGTLSAHFENTILITDGEPEILSVC
ncbi:MAG: type I methionyl aminopeptidase [Candidatus Cloacimonetes bacterium]|jgi:methionyl aminopeptidase|nr:type I methionyl aminopeptidase [Candidatus Cloacimonadota bacterium]MBT6993546.1 type I methionyl aminopeptidase [Candidatus Cloacimonadota bacterium]MBT7470284.1 type I methionyl aminopeptidase [Candidatus Cloacimonadota bacterium]